MDVDRENITEHRIFLTEKDLEEIGRGYPISCEVGADSYHKKTRYIVEIIINKEPDDNN